jgi:hypothetical protein
MPAYAPVQLPASKYLRLILDKRVLLPTGGDGHVTFLYYGKVAVDLSLASRVLKDLQPFTLSSPKAEKVGKAFDIDAVCYSIEGTLVDTLRRCLLRAYELEDQNFIAYHPHVSGLTMDDVEKQKLGTLTVLGLETNDQGWRVLF